MTLRVYRLSVGISADRFVQHNRDITVLSHTSTELGDLVSRAMIRWFGALSLVRSARRHMATFLLARLSFPSPGMWGFLCGPIVRWHVSKMLFSAREHLASLGLIWPKVGYASIA